MTDELTAELRWRLILGIAKERDKGGGGGGGAASAGENPEGRDKSNAGDVWGRRERLLSYLYDREYGKDRNTILGPRDGSLDDSNLSVPDWINSVQELFPEKTCERLEADAIERYQIDAFVTNPEALARATPSESLLKSIMRTKHLMNQEVLNVAREIVRKVVSDLLKKLSVPVTQPFTGVKNRNRRSYLKIFQNFDVKTTIRKNLKHYDKDRKQLVIENPHFYSRVRRQVDRWKIIILVDQSGSMVDSVIHSAVTASIFHQLPGIKTHLVAFDTNIVDLTSECFDPVETLMKVQLGGGTDIGHAVKYASQLVEEPARTIVILISDFYEGANEGVLLGLCRQLIESRVKLLCLAALDSRAKPVYNHDVANKLVQLGAQLGAMTPGELATWVAEKIGGGKG